MTETHTCQETVGPYYRGNLCGKSAKYHEPQPGRVIGTRVGAGSQAGQPVEWFCGTHSPAQKAARDKAARDRRMAEVRAAEEARSRRTAMAEARVDDVVKALRIESTEARAEYSTYTGTTGWVSLSPTAVEHLLGRLETLDVLEAES